MAKWEGSKCFSQFHNIEITRKKRNLNGKALVEKYSRADLFSSLNSYIEENIDDFYVFVDNELDKLYGSEHSFYKVLYGNIKTAKEINDEFPEVVVEHVHCLNRYTLVHRAAMGKPQCTEHPPHFAAQWLMLWRLHLPCRHFHDPNSHCALLALSKNSLPS